MKTVAHDVCPHAAGGAELGYLFKQVIVAVEEEGESPCKSVYIESSIQGGLYVTNCIGKRESHLLDSRRACLAYMIATDADRIPAGHMRSAVTEHIGDDAHRMLRRGEGSFLRAGLFLRPRFASAAQRSAITALFFCHI